MTSGGRRRRKKKIKSDNRRQKAYHVLLSGTSMERKYSEFVGRVFNYRERCLMVLERLHKIKRRGQREGRQRERGRQNKVLLSRQGQKHNMA